MGTYTFCCVGCKWHPKRQTHATMGRARESTSRGYCLMVENEGEYKFLCKKGKRISFGGASRAFGGASRASLLCLMELFQEAPPAPHVWHDPDILWMAGTPKYESYFVLLHFPFPFPCPSPTTATPSTEHPEQGDEHGLQEHNAHVPPTVSTHSEHRAASFRCPA